MLRFLVGFLLAPAQALGSQGTLAGAEIEIALARSESAQDPQAGVMARYRFTGTTGPIRFNAIRLRGQRLLLENVVGDVEALDADTLPGLMYLELVALSADTVEIELQYVVQGDLARLALFVPDRPAAPPLSDIRITIDGVPANRGAIGRFPRFEVDDAGRLIATPDHLPSFVSLPAADSALAVPRLAEWIVLVVVLAGTAAWVGWLRTLRIRAARTR